MHSEMYVTRSFPDRFFHSRKMQNISQADTVRISKEFSSILRHNIARYPTLHMDSEGFVLLSSLLELPFFKSRKVDVQFVEQLVHADSKTRFKLRQKEGELCIRANQGHSEHVGASVDMSALLMPVESPREIPKAIHGTAMAAWETIRAEGLRRMKRSHIHFAPGVLGEDGVRSGMRSSADVHIHVDAAKAMADGIQFYRSDNNVILSEGINGVIAPKYFSRVENNRTGESLI